MKERVVVSSSAEETKKRAAETLDKAVKRGEFAIETLLGPNFGHGIQTSSQKSKHTRSGRTSSSSK